MSDFRLLEKGETIQPGDEFLDDIKGWIPSRCIGGEAPDPSFTAHRQYRRPLTFAQKVEPAMMAISHWLISGKYRTVQHRHDGSYRAIDDVSKDEWNAETLVELVELMQSTKTKGIK